MTDEVRRHIFEPFYTTSEQGTGLGLYLAREICEANGARLSYLPIPSGTGSCFRIKFPLNTEISVTIPEESMVEFIDCKTNIYHLKNNGLILDLWYCRTTEFIFN